MSQPYIGEIRLFGGSFPPYGWAFCDGAVMPISENDTLFSLIGTTYGGDGQNTFGLPDLRGRVPIHKGTSRTGTTYVLGTFGGVEQVTLTTNQIPSHNHTPTVNSQYGSSNTPAANTWAQSGLSVFAPTSAPRVNMMAGTLTPNGGNQPHDNMMPFTVISFIISLYGIYPQRP